MEVFLVRALKGRVLITVSDQNLIVIDRDDGLMLELWLHVTSPHEERPRDLTEKKNKKD